MSTIQSSIRLYDGVTGTLQSMYDAISSVISALESTQDAMDGAFDSGAIDDARDALDGISGDIESLQDQIEDLGDAQEDAAGATDDLVDSVKDLAKAYLTVQAAQEALDWAGSAMEAANTQHNAENQLRAVAQNMGMTEEAYESLTAKASEIQGRGIYGDESMIGAAAEFATYMSDVDAISTMMDTLSNYAAGMSGGGAIDYNEMVDYATQLGKALNGSYDGLLKKGFSLTDEQKEIIENGTDMQKALVIQDVIGESWDGLYAAMSNTPQGKIIALQNTIGDMMETIGDRFYSAVGPMVDFLTDNLDTIEWGINLACSAVMVLIGAIEAIGTVAMTAFGFVREHIDVLGPMIAGLATYMAIYAAVTSAATIKEAALGAATAAWGAISAVAGAIASSHLLIIIGVITAIIVTIVALINHINKVQGTTISVLGVITGALNAVWNVIKAVAENMITAFHNAISNIQAMFYSMASYILGIISKIASALSALPFVDFDTSAIDAAASSYAAKEAAAIGEKGTYNSISDIVNTAKAGWSSGYDWGAEKQSQITDWFSGLASGDLWNQTALTGGGVSDALEDIANSGAGTEKNTGDVANALDVSNEQLALLKEIAERQAIDQFTTASVSVTLNNSITGTDSSDLDGIVSYLEDAVASAMVSAAEAAHA